MLIDFNDQMYKKIIEEIIPFHAFLGLKVLELKDGYAKLLVPFQPVLVGDPRIQRWHGGIICVLLDAAGGAAGFSLLKTPHDKISTVDIRVDFLKSSKPQDLIAEGWMIRKGSNTIHARSKVYHPGAEMDVLAEGISVYDIRLSTPKQ